MAQDFCAVFELGEDDKHVSESLSDVTDIRYIEKPPRYSTEGVFHSDRTKVSVLITARYQ